MTGTLALKSGAGHENARLVRGWYRSAGEDLFCALHLPVDRDPEKWFIIVPPFGEERKSSQRTLARLAYRIACSGYGCARFDYSGTGDSTGTMHQIDVLDWIQNLVDIGSGIRRMGKAEIAALIGVRFGSLIALRSREQIGRRVNLVLLDPILSIERYYAEMRRQKFALSLLTRTRSGSVARIAQTAEETGIFDYYGYRTNIRFWNTAIEQLRLSEDTIEGDCSTALVRNEDQEKAAAELRKARSSIQVFQHAAGKYWEMNRTSGDSQLWLGLQPLLEKACQQYEHQ